MSKYTAVFVALLLNSCGLAISENAGPTNAEDTFREFQLAVNVLDFTTAQKFATDKCKRQLQLLGVYLKMSSEEELLLKKKELFAAIKTIECQGDSTNRSCSLCCTEMGEKKIANLVLIKGKWLVDAHFGMTDHK